MELALTGGRAARDSELRRALGAQMGSSQTAAQRLASSWGPRPPREICARSISSELSLETFIQWLWDQAHGPAFLKHPK